MTIPALSLPPGLRLAVVGGCGGIGAAIVRAATAMGARCTVMDLPASIAARGAAQEGSTIPLDVRDASSVDAAFAACGPIDAAVNVFGYTGDLTPLAETAMSDFDALLDVNMRGTFLALKAEARAIVGEGAVVTISSGIASIGAAGYGPYAAAKSALNAMTRVLAAELAPRVRVNAVAPGGVDTAFLRGGFGRGGVETGPPLRMSIEDYVKRVPMGRIAEAEDVAGPALFLLTPAARYITGQVLHVNGGALMRD
jgi:3-oxoacyl-[acyl-carrier protein] reductase